MKFDVAVDIDAAAFINAQDEKTRRIIHSHLIGFISREKTMKCVICKHENDKGGDNHRNL